MWFDVTECADKCVGRPWRFHITGSYKLVTQLSTYSSSMSSHQLMAVYLDTTELASDCMLFIILAASGFTGQFQESIRPYKGIPAGLRSNWDLRWLVQEYHGSNCEKLGNTAERCRELWVHLGAPASAGDKPGSADKMSGSADDKPGHADNQPGRTCERRWHAWEHLESLKSSLGKTSSLGTQLVRLEIITTTDHSMIF